MEERIARIIRNIGTLEDLARFETNVRDRDALTDELKDAIRHRSADLGRALISEKTGLELTDLSPAEERIVQAASEFVAVRKREGKGAGRTLDQLRNRGLIDAAEISVSKSKPTQGYQTLVEADLADLSYEKIIVDHPDEFSQRAIWFSRRTLGLPNESTKPPAKAISPTQTRTESLLRWLRERSEPDGGRLPSFTNADAAAVLGMTDMHQFGRVFGNIQSRIDFACYVGGLPPLGLAADAPFDKAWNQQDRDWAFPIETMQAAARSRIWRDKDFDLVLRETERLPGSAHVSWKKELATKGTKVREWAFGLDGSNAQVASTTDESEAVSRRNPAWSRDELILALDLYLRFRRAPPAKDSSEVAELSAFLGRMGRALGLTEAETYRNANGVYMKMMNFRRFDPEYTATGRVGLTRGNKDEGLVWNDFSADPARLTAAVATIRTAVDGEHDAGQAKEDHIRVPSAEGPYWVFVCNPKKWAIDRFLDRRAEHDTWGVRPSDRDRFAPGQLGIIRVGVDRRTVAERNGNPPLEPGIYALCEVESEAFDGTGASDEFWAPGQAREPGWPTVKLRYLRTYHGSPLTIERLRAERPGISELLLNGFQAASFPIAANDFRAVMALLGEELDDLPSPAQQSAVTPDKLATMEEKYLHATPEVKERVSRTIERGPVGALVKQATGFKCQLCEALGLNPVGFLKENGEPYVEAHHVMPISKKEVGSLAASNVMTLCANHHRQIHYGGIDIVISATTFELVIGGTPVKIPRLHGICGVRERNE
jgi:predicted HNH restriction endonuclease